MIEYEPEFGAYGARCSECQTYVFGTSAVDAMYNLGAACTCSSHKEQTVKAAKAIDEAWERNR